MKVETNKYSDVKDPLKTNECMNEHYLNAL